MAKYLIWWTNQSDCERITPLDTWPTWLYDEYQSRLGRPGRGRLWVSDEWSDAPEQADWDYSKWTCHSAADAGGIVIPLDAIHHVMLLPGFVTNFLMEIPDLTELVVRGLT